MLCFWSLGALSGLLKTLQEGEREMGRDGDCDIERHREEDDKV